jgi:hypothetical protein
MGEGTRKGMWIRLHYRHVGKCHNETHNLLQLTYPSENKGEKRKKMEISSIWSQRSKNQDLIQEIIICCWLCNEDHNN